MKVDIAQELREVLGPESSAGLAARVGSEQECGVCGHRLGQTMAALSAQYLPGPSYQERWVLSVHHRRCGPSALTRTGVIQLRGSQYTGISFAVRAFRGSAEPRRRLFRRTRRDFEVQPTLMPVCLVNPSLGEMVIEPAGNDTFVDISIDYFRELGWVPMQHVAMGRLDTDPLATCSIKDADTVVINPGTGAQWDLPAGEEITDAVTAVQGLMVIVTHDMPVGDLIDDPRPSRLYADGNIAYCTWAELT